MTIRILSWRADSFTHEADDLRSADNDLLTHAKERMESSASGIKVSAHQERIRIVILHLVMDQDKKRVFSGLRRAVRPART